MFLMLLYGLITGAIEVLMTSHCTTLFGSNWKRYFKREMVRGDSAALFPAESGSLRMKCLDLSSSGLPVHSVLRSGSARWPLKDFIFHHRNNSANGKRSDL